MRLTAAQLGLFLPADVAARTADEPGVLDARRLEVSVLSCDVSSFRPLAEARPRDALDVLNGILAGAAGAIFAEGGTLMSFPGDGALAVFGAPLTDPEHRARADRAATAIAGPVIDAARDRLAAAGLPAVGMDVAVESGEALCGVIGAEPRWEYAVIGAVTGRAIARTSG